MIRRQVERAAMFRRGVDETDAELAAELEALLVGAYAEYLQRRGRRVPAWAWTNLLAHGSEDDLGRAATSRSRQFREVNVWRRARSYLASEVLDAADRAGSLAVVQAAVLVPLELDLMCWTPSRWTAAGQWASRVLSVLDDRGHGVTRTAPEK